MLAAFAESIEPVDAKTAGLMLERHCRSRSWRATPATRAPTAASSSPGHSLRASQQQKADEHDLAADAMLGEIEAPERGGPIQEAPPQLLFVAMNDLRGRAALAGRLPGGTDAAEVAAFYADLPRACGARTTPTTSRRSSCSR